MRLTPEQELALIHWRSRYGRVWKTRLHEAWQTGDYRYSPHASVLQELRNVIGPSKLSRLSFTPTRKASRLAP